MRGSLKCPSVPYLPQPFSQSLPNACIIFLAEVLLLPRAPPHLALSPKNSALICSRTNLPRSRKARLPAPSSAQGGLGSVVPPPSFLSGKAPQVRRGAPPRLHTRMAAPVSAGPPRAMRSGGSREQTRRPKKVSGTTYSKMPCAGFRSALRVQTRD